MPFHYLISILFFFFFHFFFLGLSKGNSTAITKSSSKEKEKERGTTFLNNNIQKYREPVKQGGNALSIHLVAQIVFITIYRLTCRDIQSAIHRYKHMNIYSIISFRFFSPGYLITGFIQTKQ